MYETKSSRGKFEGAILISDINWNFLEIKLLFSISGESRNIFKWIVSGVKY